MKKKIFALVLVVALVASVAVGLAACDNDSKIVTVGYTLYSPMNYIENNELIGFDTELAKAVFAELGYEVVFKEINWGQKYVELNSGSVDCLWNGFTANGADDGTPRDQLVDFSYKYMINKQCVVVRTDGDYANATFDMLNSATVSGAFESGSAGEEYVATNMPNCTQKGATSQMTALTEVNTRASQFAVVDYLLANSIVGQGDYSNLKIIDELSSEDEQYAIGFRKGDTLRDEVNAVLQKFIEDGTTLKIAEKYGLQNALITDYSVLG
ncbi:MAG: transporter substrate-binding domain-containing protein [Christensenellales bacterium]|nr:transporter substrate-binding domain-containing protein [Christensenellales bacterium]